MSMEAAKYEEVIPALVAAGCRAQFQRPGQLVVCLDEPCFAGRIWIAWRQRWFISTWTPTVYSVPDDVDVVALCVACVGHKDTGTPFYQISDEIAQHYRLRRLDERETDEFLDSFDSMDKL